MPKQSTLLAAIAVFVLAPILAAVLISTLLLVGVEPHLVFLAGNFVKARFHAPNSVGVVTTEIVWWAVIVAVWLLLRRLWRGRAQRG